MIGAPGLIRFPTAGQSLRGLIDFPGGSGSSTPVDIPIPMYAWTPNANGTAANTAGCQPLFGFGANLPTAGNAVRGYSWDFGANGSKSLHANSAIANTTSQSWWLSFDVRLACTTPTTQALVSQIIPGSGTFAVYYVSGSIIAGVTLANGTFRSVGGTALTPFTWHQVNCTGNAANSTVTVNNDGAFASSINTANWPLQAGANFTVGSHADRTFPANGSIGQVVMTVGNTTLPTSTQIANRNQNGRSRLYTSSGWAPNDNTQYPTGRLGNLTTSVPGRPVVIDTDVGEDIGDYKALFLCLREHLLGNISLKGVVVTTTIDKGAAAAWVLGNYAGLAATVPVYAYQSGLSPLTAIVDNYANATATQFGNTTSRAGFTDSTTGYYNLLSNATDGSITLCMTGFAAGANAFIQSSAGNKTLFNQKIGTLVIAAGQFPTGAAEYNLFQDSANWTQLLSNTSMARLWSPFTMGCVANTGSTIGALNANNPLRYANGQFGAGNFSVTRPMWDELGVQASCYGTLNWLKFSDPDILCTVFAANGCNIWTPVAGNDTCQQVVRPAADYTAYYDAKWCNFPIT